MGIDGDVDRDNGRWVYGSWAFHAISRRSKDVRDILRSPTSVWQGRRRRSMARRRRWVRWERENSRNGESINRHVSGGLFYKGGEEQKMEGWSFLYKVREDLACFRFRSGTQESSSAEYPFHWIRKEREDGVLRWHMIFLISYSSSPLIRSGGGAGKFRSWILFSW